MKEYLFICQHNFTRSKFGAEFLRGYLRGRKIDAKVRSAGMGFLSYFLGKKINKRILNRADKIFVMEKYMEKFLKENFSVEKTKIINLNIKDEYGFLRRKSVDQLDSVLQKINWGKIL